MSGLQLLVISIKIGPVPLFQAQIIQMSYQNVQEGLGFTVERIKI